MSDTPEWTAAEELKANQYTRDLCERLGFPINDLAPDPAPEILAKQQMVAWVIIDCAKAFKGITP